jgi:hypothetical protein
MRVVLVVTVVIATLMSGPASATPPERHSLGFDETFETAGICGFPITFEWIGTGYGTVFLDSDGHFIRQLDRIREHLIVTNVETGAAVSGHDAYQLTGTDESLTRTGSWFHLGAPGTGIVLKDVGRIVVTSDGEVKAIVGRHQWVAGDFAALCHALAT